MLVEKNLKINPSVRNDCKGFLCISCPRLFAKVLKIVYKSLDGKKRIVFKWNLKDSC